MADENKKDEYDSRIKKHRLRIRVIIILLFIVAVVIAVVSVVKKTKSQYGSYEVLNTQVRDDSGYAEFVRFGRSYVKYGRDGAACWDFEGQSKWNYAYQLNQPCVDICGGYMVIAGTNDNKAYLFNNEGYVTDISTGLPIMQINVSSQGLIVAMTDDADSTHISMFDKDGNKIFDIKSAIENDGVPVSMSVSDDGEKLVASFTAVEGQQLKTSVVFYNFGTVGQSENERVVGGYDTYGQQIVSKVEFINSTTAVAFGQKMLSFYQVKEYPKLLADVSLDYEIKKIFYSDSYVGLVYMDDSNRNMIDVFNTSGEKTVTLEVPDGYVNYAFASSAVMMYGEESCRLVDFSGKEIFGYTFEDRITALIPASGNDRYVYITPGKIMVIKLKYGG